MKYSLMSLMISDVLKVRKPSFIQKLIMRGMGYTGPDPENAEDFFAFMNSRGIPAKNGTMEFEDYVKFAKDNGFDGVDMMSFHLEVDGDYARRVLERYSITLSAVNIIAPFSGAATEEECSLVFEQTKEIIDRAYAAGCRNILLMPYGYEPDPGMTREMTYQNSVRGLKACVEYGEKIGMTINTETLESVGVPHCSIGEMLRVFGEVKGLKYTHDTGNPIVATEDPIETYEHFKDRLANVHFKDLEFIKGNIDDVPRNERYMDSCGRWLKRAVLGEGEIDFKKHLEVLKRDGYTGFITIEGQRPGRNLLEQAVNALEYFRHIEKEV